MPHVASRYWRDFKSKLEDAIKVPTSVHVRENGTWLLRVFAATTRQRIGNFCFVTRDHKHYSQPVWKLFRGDFHERPDGIQAEYHFFC
ncbi:hypothetical protein D3C73_991720 [compost metagenome]